MAFNTEIQSSQPRRQAIVNEINNQNRAIRTGPRETSPTHDQNNCKFREIEKYNTGDTGTTRGRSSRNSVNEFDEYNREQVVEQNQESKQQQKDSKKIDTNTTEKFETKNIFAYQAFETATGSVRNATCATPPEEQINLVTSPPFSENSDSNPGSCTETTSSNRITLFTKVPSANVFSEKQYAPSSKERFEQNSRERVRRTDSARNANNIRTGDSFSPVYSGDQQKQSVANAPRNCQQHKNQTFSRQLEFVREQSYRTRSANAIRNTIDFGINGRHRVDRCRYVPFTSGYEWSNAAYCYS